MNKLPIGTAGLIIFKKDIDLEEMKQNEVSKNTKECDLN